MKTIFIYGAPAAGKLTVANELAKRTGFSVLHNHLINDLIIPWQRSELLNFGILLGNIVWVLWSVRQS